MPEGYTSTYNENGGGLCIGETSTNNIKVYIDNCNIYGSVNPIVLRGLEGEQKNTLYISNSKINTDKNIIIDNGQLYIGVGNNFTDVNTTLPSAVITEDKTYIQNQ